MNIQTGMSPNVLANAARVANPAPANGPVQSPGQPNNPLPPNPGSGFLDTLTRGIVTFTYESGAVLENDPALAVRQFATTVHEVASRGYSGADLQAWAPMIGAGARTLILGANVWRAKKTYSTPGASLLDKSLDTARVATDLVGVAGAMLRAVSPSHAALGTTMMGIAQGADLVSHGARFGLHSAPRVNAWLREHEEKKARERARERQRERILDEQLGIPPAAMGTVAAPSILPAT